MKPMHPLSCFSYVELYVKTTTVSALWKIKYKECEQGTTKAQPIALW